MAEFVRYDPNSDAVALARRQHFAATASVEAIEATLGAARKALRAHQRYVEWLEGLRHTRADQTAAGTWPPHPNESGDAAAFPEHASLDEAFASSRAAFPEPTPLELMPMILDVVHGDAARLIRDATAARLPLDRAELAREWANAALTCRRFIDDLGQDWNHALAAAAASHTRHAAQLKEHQ